MIRSLEGSVRDPEPRPRWRSGIMLGIGLGGFLDGILLHQIIHWHNMGSAVLPPSSMEALQQNMAWDGLFHLVVWICTLVGAYWLLADVQRVSSFLSARRFTGLLILGWGLFNLTEGLIDHHLLGLHHVRDLPRHMPVYDWLFLLVGGLGFIGLGYLLYRRREY